MYYVYSIKIDNIIRYIGITKDIIKREKQHNYGIKTGIKKRFYENMSHYYPNQTVSLEVLKIFKTKTDAARYEAHLILLDYFNNSPKELWQSPPRVIKYF
jgi:predicted GIY-YIG superfamily endonuclease